MKKFFKYLGLFIKNLLRFLLKPLSFLPAIFVMYMIITFSSQTGIESGNLSYKVSAQIVTTTDEALSLNLTNEQRFSYIEKIHHSVRKLAHFTEYLILAMSVAFPLYVYRLRGFPLVIITGLFCFCFAYFDEFMLQAYVSGRTPAKKDVLIDTSGAILGVFITRIIGYIGRKTIFRPLAKED